MVSHPPHLLDQMNTTSPSTLIPFCAFQSQLNFSKSSTFLPNSPFPVCNSFTPVALNGQLCYNVEVNLTGRNGKDGGLALVLDLNEDRSLSFDSLSHSEAEEDFTMWRLDERDQDAKIHHRLLTLLGLVWKLSNDAFLDMDSRQRK